MESKNIIIDFMEVLRGSLMLKDEVYCKEEMFYNQLTKLEELIPDEFKEEIGELRSLYIELEKEIKTTYMDYGYCLCESKEIQK
ncbi:hypothetical protein H3N56_10285 [Cetobacterium sp. 2A]|uniref:hypothetical protein n=1 Tax=Cetobacterium sp. 2A TaxID=2754723 RepID=UPI00163BF4E3|nr:hypothetical protein [Cetobacterium sp. 2A]MBC2856828.1 hypothetical protein [Cetobacterium sp. 2A]